MFLITPILLISTSTISPSCSHAGGFIKAATPLGVPVIITVFLLDFDPLLRCLVMAGLSNIMSLSFVECLSCPFTFVERSKLEGPGMVFGEMSTGPMGADLPKDSA